MNNSLLQTLREFEQDQLFALSKRPHLETELAYTKVVVSKLMLDEIGAKFQIDFSSEPFFTIKTFWKLQGDSFKVRDHYIFAGENDLGDPIKHGQGLFVG